MGSQLDAIGPVSVQQLSTLVADFQGTETL